MSEVLIMIYSGLVLVLKDAGPRCSPRPEQSLSLEGEIGYQQILYEVKC